MNLLSGSTLPRLRKLIHLSHPRNAYRYWRNGEMPAYEIANIPLRPDALTVLDVGANRGQFLLLHESMFPLARVVCFEPGASARGSLVAVADQFSPGTVEIRNEALWFENADGTLNIPRGADDGSSLIERFPQQTTEEVVLRRLDSLNLATELRSPVILKIDVQGAEAAVLRGSVDTLARVSQVLVEVTMNAPWDRSIPAEVFNILDHQGFGLRGIFNVRSYGSIGNADLLFER